MKGQAYTDGKSVTQEDVLAAKESRMQFRQKILTRYGKVLICFSLNIPGVVKQFRMSQLAFEEGKSSIVNQLERIRAEIVYQKIAGDLLGEYAFFAVEAEPETVKHAMIEIEDFDQYTRIFDIDVVKPDGTELSRVDLGYRPRRCFLCSESAHICAARSRHTKEETVEFVFSALSKHLNRKFAGFMSDLAVKSLLYEVSVTPKPGLVDMRDCGSHTDMDFYSFLNGISSLPAFFSEVTEYAASFEGSPFELARKVRILGKDAETTMRKATGGANTHKGAIFSLGLICAAAGFLFEAEKRPSFNDILNECSLLAGGEFCRDFLEIDPANYRTRGEEQHLKYGLTGARGEAASAYHSVQEHAYPALQSALQQGFSMNDAGVYAILRLIENVNDSNIIGRSSLFTQKTIKAMVKAEVNAAKLDAASIRSLAEKMNEYFISSGLSPGGCADLLSVTFMMHFYNQTEFLGDI